MHQTATFLAITVKSLVRAPAPVQTYVKEFFKQTTVLGQDCWVAFVGSLRRTYGDSSHRNRGVAPGFLWEEFHVFLKSNPTDCFKFYASWDDGVSGPEPD